MPRHFAVLFHLRRQTRGRVAIERLNDGRKPSASAIRKTTNVAVSHVQWRMSAYRVVSLSSTAVTGYLYVARAHEDSFRVEG